MSDLITLQRHTDVSVITLSNGENRWTTSLVRDLGDALDDVESNDGPHALVTASSDPKFFSNGLDVEWFTGNETHHGGDVEPFAEEFMALAARLITFPMPTVGAINGHAFGAGFMWALSHDQRVMRVDRGLMCANEIEIGIAMPAPELAIFLHKMPQNAFYQTVQFAKRWTAKDAFDVGIVQELADESTVTEKAIQRAQSLAHLAERREIFGWMKEQIWGEHAAINGPHGPAHMLRNMREYPSGPGLGLDG
ncbi:MAG: enoyl-CoA hydratase/isomerase family protein [Actinomycetota bacterium]|nr:enoyl-CoA hydratase/isomerase family protein [Acidimicrobiales bacterium]MEC8976401.1 enoyl-CoA hydratase/isomerase family protein [Actinomycetota bacterium]MED5173024.1 enoyl-CoA hydratase/isomerase family protein [Actinomycetota bacterium]MED6304220.1 enoyl-CoA hydratase/isomerase family protein [Actinomycetota bacterium]